MESHRLVRLRNETRVWVAIPGPRRENRVGASTAVLRLEHDRPAIPERVEEPHRVLDVLIALNHELELAPLFRELEQALQSRELRLDRIAVERLRAPSLRRDGPEVDAIERL